MINKYLNRFGRDSLHFEGALVGLDAVVMEFEFGSKEAKFELATTSPT